MQSQARGATCVLPSSTWGLALIPRHCQACHPFYWSGKPLRRDYSLKPCWNTFKNSFTPNREKAKVAHRADHPLGELVPESAQHSGGGAEVLAGVGGWRPGVPLCAAMAGRPLRETPQEKGREQLGGLPTFLVPRQECGPPRPCRASTQPPLYRPPATRAIDLLETTKLLNTCPAI